MNTQRELIESVPNDVVKPHSAKMTDGAVYILDLLSELQKIADVSGLDSLSKDLTEMMIRHSPPNH